MHQGNSFIVGVVRLYMFRAYAPIFRSNSSESGVLILFYAKFAVTVPTVLGSSYLQVSSLFIFSPYVQHVLPISCSFFVTLLVFDEAYKVMKLHVT
jgi:hypothetical protein